MDGSALDAANARSLRPRHHGRAPTPRSSATAPPLAVLVTAGHKDVLVVGPRQPHGDVQHQGAAAAGPSCRARSASRSSERLRVDGSVLRPLDEDEVHGDRRAAGGGGRRGGRDLLPALLRQPASTSGAAPSHRRGGAARSAVVTTSADVLPEIPRVRARSRRRRSTPMSPRACGVTSATCATPRGVGLSPRRFDHDLERRRAAGPPGRGACPCSRCSRARRRGVIAASPVGRRRRPSRPDHLRHGRHVDRRLPRRGGELRHDHGGPRRRVPDQDPRRSTSTRSARRRQRRLGSTPAASCPWGRARRRRSRAPPATAAAGRSPPSPTPTSCSAGSARTSRSAARSRSIAERARRAIGEARRRASALGRTAMAEGILRIAAVSLAGRDQGGLDHARHRSARLRAGALRRRRGRSTRPTSPRSSGCATVVVPPLPGNFSAFGPAHRRFAARPRAHARVA